MSDRQPGSTLETLSILLLRWRELRQQGQPCAAADLCADRPELASELRQRIEAVQAMERRLAALDSGPDAATVVPAADIVDPFAVPGYELLEVLGRGGMGVVYKARQLQLKRLVALKMIRSAPGGDREHLSRFRIEAEALARARHPNIIEIYDIGEADGQPYFTMELAEGGSLAALAGPLPATEAARLVLTLAEAMHVAHQRGILHRDLKPANILLASGGRKPPERAVDSGGLRPPLAPCAPKITDFGLAKLIEENGQTHSGTILGTPSYMAPEQAEGRTREIGPAADTYALGALLYELLAGKPPFTGQTTMEILFQVVAREPVRPSKLRADVPAAVEAVCLKCLEKDPARRYASAAALADDLRRFLDEQPVRARRPGRLRRAGHRIRRHPTRTVLAVLVLAVLLGALANGLRHPGTSPTLATPSTRAVVLAPRARQILRKYCFPCHGQDPGHTQGKLTILDHSLLIAPGRKLVVPGDPRASLLIHRIEDNSMPPDEAEEYPRLSSDEIEVLKTWVASGAPRFAPPGADDRPPPVAAAPLAVAVKEIFRARCHECHRVGKARNGIKILNHDLLVVKRGVVVPGKPGSSSLFALLTGSGDGNFMPPSPRKPLSAAEIDIIRRWILTGAAPFPQSWRP